MIQQRRHVRNGLLQSSCANRAAPLVVGALLLVGLFADAGMTRAASPEGQIANAADSRKATSGEALAGTSAGSGPQTIVVPFVIATEDSKGDEAGKDKEDAAKDKEKNKDKDKDAEALPLPPSTPVELTPAEQYCSNVIDAAAAAQIAQRKANLEKAQKQIDERIALIASRTEELKGWIKMREEFTARATDSLVQIYAKMKPDAAAGQLVAMDELVAAAIMSKLSPKVASLIMTEMEAAKAARLSAVIAGAGDIVKKAEPKANAQQ
jgi:flagellar motility protein MotE (MotC chaperone)